MRGWTASRFPLPEVGGGRAGLMSWQAWFTAAVIVIAFVLMARDRYPPSLVIFGAVVILLLAGVIDTAQALQGFSNPAPITVAALYVLARAVEKTGLLQPMVSGMLGKGTGQRAALARLVFPTAAASAFLNNTPIVAMLVPQVTEWARRTGQSPSRYLMPLSFAAILGGVVTLIGTSTNLVISGLLVAYGYEPLGMFDITRIGLPVALVGLLIIVMLAPMLLPDRKDVRDEDAAAVREFVVAMVVESGGQVDGKTVEEAGLRSLEGVYLVEVDRGGEIMTPVSPDRTLRGGDRLKFVGQADTIVDLQNKRGLVSSEREQLADLMSPRHAFFEVVIGAASPLVGTSIKKVGFRARYLAAVIAIHRSGQRVAGKLGDVPLKTGDTLLLLAERGFGRRWRDRNDFLLVSRRGEPGPRDPKNTWLVGIIVGLVVVGAAVGAVPILHLALASAVALVVFGVLSPGEARGAVDLDVILVIAAAFGLGAALQASGIAETLGHLITEVAGNSGSTGATIAIAVVTIALLGVVTNNAAAALMFPVGLAVAAELGMDPRPIAIAVAASAAFLTPIAYQTNLMVYGPGGYRFGDYARLGVPLVGAVVAVLIITLSAF